MTNNERLKEEFMMKSKLPMLAILKKDFRGVAANKRMFAALWAVPLVFTAFLPALFLVVLRFLPQDAGELQKLLTLLPAEKQSGEIETTLLGLFLNYLLPVFFLMIPIMASSIMAATSFVGEKEKRTLETLLYAPLTLRQIFRAKVLASFLLSMLVSFLSFFVMLLVLEAGSFLLFQQLILPEVSWALIMLLVSPAVSLIAITLMVRVSAKAQSVEEAQQGAVFLILPILLLFVGQFNGVMLLSAWLLLLIGVACAGLAVLLFQRSLKNFQYEILLK